MQYNDDEIDALMKANMDSDKTDQELNIEENSNDVKDFDDLLNKFICDGQRFRYLMTHSKEIHKFLELFSDPN